MWEIYYTKYTESKKIDCRKTLKFSIIKPIIAIAHSAYMKGRLILWLKKGR